MKANTSRSHKRFIHNINNSNKTWLGFFLLYLRKNIKPYTSYRLGLELENSAEKHSAQVLIDQV